MVDTGRKGEQTQRLLLDVALAPTLLRPSDAELAEHVIVVDVIRATTTLCTFFDRGCREVLVAGSIDLAREARRELTEDSLLAGEQGGTRPVRFDLGNSPVEASQQELTNAVIVFATTNGTRALHASQGRASVFAGSMRNAQAVAAAVIGRILSDTSVTSRVTVLCAGFAEGPALDDTLCAGHIVKRILDHAANTFAALQVTDSALLALELAEGAPDTESILSIFERSAAGRAVIDIGLAHDLSMCAQLDVSDMVPVVTDSTADGLLVMRNQTSTHNMEKS